MALKTFTANTLIQSSEVNSNFAQCLLKADVSTSGGLLYGNGTTAAQDATYLFYNSTTRRLGVGIGSGISGKIHVVADASTATVALFKSATTDSTTYPIILRDSGDTSIAYVRSDGVTYTETLAVGLTPASRNNTYIDTAGGIGFPATQVSSSDANVLDDYEEGTWTPSVGGTATYTQQHGTYVKIGKKVFIEMYLIINTIGTGSTTTVSGLPFTVAGNTVGGVSINYWNSTSSLYVFLTAFVSTTTLLFYGCTAGATTLSSLATFQNSTYIRCHGHYTTS